MIRTDPTRELVLKKLHDCFPDAVKAGEALAILDTYGTESWHREKDRVHLALLKISDGDLEKLRLYTRGAQSDFRNTLIPAEYPEEGQTLARTSPQQLNEIRRRDRQQYEAWLRAPEQK